MCGHFSSEEVLGMADYPKVINSSAEFKASWRAEARIFFIVQNRVGIQNILFKTLWDQNADF